MKVSAILFDLEGVLLGAKTHDVLPYAADVLKYCMKENIPFCIISNNTVQKPEAILQILEERGLAIDSDQLLTPLKFLKNELEKISTALVIGSDNLVQFIVEQGIEVRHSADVEVVICGGGYTISNDKLYAAYSAIAENKSRFLSLHKNRVFNDAEGVTRPDVGGIVAGLEYSTGVRAKTLGKPSPDYFAKAIQDWNIKPENILLISDDPISDLGGGHTLGYQTAFVCTGKYKIDIVKDLEVKPDMIWPSLKEGLEKLIERN